MKIVVVDKKNIILKVQKDTFKVDEQSIPFRLVDMLILNHKVSLNSADILKFTKENVSLLFVSAKSDHLALLLSKNAKASDLKEAQYSALSKRLIISKYLIKQKILEHKEQLQKHQIVVDIEDVLEQIDKARSVKTLMGIEGTFARLYFKHYFSFFDESFQKGKRSKNPPQDPLNALMSYFYMLYYNLISVALASYGFELGISYLHTPFRTHNALSSDLMELFRADINEAVFKIFDEKLVDLEDFSFKGAVYLRYEARKKIWKSFIALANDLKPKLDKEISKLKGVINETESYR